MPAESIGERLLPRGLEPATGAGRDWMRAKRMGYRAEMELIRRTADSERINVFKAFPDLEPNEYLLYDTTSRGLVGIQVKSITFRRGATEAHASVYRPALRPSPTTWFVIFLEDEGETAFAEHCVVMPSAVVAEYLAGHTTRGKLTVTRGVTGRLAPWRVPLAGLGARLAELAASMG